MTCRIACLVNSAIASSTRCGRSHRAIGVHTARSESRARRRRDLCQQPESGCRQSHHRARSRRSTGLHTAGQGHPNAGTARPDCAAALSHGRNHAGRATNATPSQSGGRQVRHRHQSRIRLRNARSARASIDFRCSAAAIRACSRFALRTSKHSRVQLDHQEAQRMDVRHQSPTRRRPSRRQGAVEAMAKSAMRTAGNQLGKKLLRGVLGSLMK